jgi:SPP1 family predicted phage head-tail adaptor
MNPGDFDQRIVIQNVSEAVDQFGQRIRSFSTLAAVWAKVEEKSGTEGEVSYQLTANKKVQFMIRWRNDVNEKMPIVYRGKIYEIESIISDDARKHTMKIHARLSDSTLMKWDLFIEKWESASTQWQLI